ncbi:hypothetical protein A3F08_00735 [Candidatus Berkelbacteria bacterium RIFCSPHIGHO2_12_FULL_36_9]|uniref:Phosphatidic acid phosphatase type 2/haloperoxidase domain-containing protein n=1 Tax=Candidatus Berkelbacteria bacterium RIFCSPHIGHO2_12_FULL_36_9 TaxID=1797469 RepID=A0A1F5EJG1_9BACT|nr:MAG: hypothetical protein A3F08_00735 [Candidatus Berkelbacteria bacterium RIFCSPHIGHO2_12_FULL_36_9]
MTNYLRKIKQIAICGLVILIGLSLLKYLPMYIWGKNILFDASGHIATAVFILYILWFFIDQNEKWRLPYLIFSFLILAIIAMQRILDNAHNDLGLLLGLIIGLLGIIFSRWKYFKDKIDF